MDEGRWTRIKKVMEGVLNQMGKEEENEDIKWKRWWDEKCEKSRKVLWECVKKWETGRMDKADYNKKHKEYGKLIKRKE